MRGSLRNYLLVRIALAVPLVLILLTLVFVLMRVAPGDPITAALGGRLSVQELAQRRHEIGLDRPIFVQYIDYLRSTLSGHFGHAITDNRSVSSIIVQNGSATLELSLAALVVATIVGMGLGIIGGRFKNSLIDLGSRLFGIVVYATPVFFLGLLGQLLFGSALGWLPTSGQASPLVEFLLPQHTHLLVLDSLIAHNWSALRDVLSHLVLPAVTLGLVMSGVLIRIVRINLLQSLRGDFIEAARARGIGERAVVLRHAFRNALVPVVAVFGLQFALLLSGAVLTEETFNWPGIGFTLVNYLGNRDYTAVQGIVTFLTLIVVGASVLIDVVTAWVDPRVRYG